MRRNIRWSGQVIGCAALFSLFAFPVCAQSEDMSAPPAPARVLVAPAEVREVVAEGRAAIGAGGVLGARKAAEAQALRNAVEKTTGVYVSSRTLTQNYQMVRDQVFLRAEGFATLKQVLKEEIGAQEVRVVVRAFVSLKPLAERLKALNLTRAWRVHVTGQGPRGSAATTMMERTLGEAGFVVVDETDKEADLTVLLTPVFTTVAETNLETAAGPMTMHSVRGDLKVRATRVGTGEVIAALTSADTAVHINLATARAEAAEGAAETLAPRLAEALMVLPARESQPITLTISGLSSARQVGRLEDSLNVVTGVRDVKRRSFNGGTAVWELDVFTDAQPMLARQLEESPLLRAFRLSVSSENRNRIAASASPPAANTRPRQRS